MKPVILISILCLVSFFGFEIMKPNQNSLKPPPAVQGVVDATHWNLQTDGNLILSGEWEFYWNQLVEPQTFVSGEYPISFQYVQVPDIWSNYHKDGNSISNQGFATYHLVINLREEDKNRILAFYLPNVATAYNLWVNGKLLAANGVVGENRKQMVPKNYPKVVYFQPETSNLEVVVQVSNFVQRKGGLWQAIELGDSQAITRIRDIQILVDSFVTTSLIVIGLFKLANFLFYRKFKPGFYFAILCLGLALRNLLLGQTLLVYLVPDLSWEFTTKLEYLTSTLAPFLCVMFLSEQYPLEIHKWARGITLCFGILASSLVLLTPGRIYTQYIIEIEIMVFLTFVYLTFTNFLAVIRKRELALLDLIALLIFFAAAFNDMLFYNQLVSTANYSSLGFLAFLYSRAINFINRTSKAYKETEELTVQIQSYNASLKEQVLQRTKELEESNQKLASLNEELNRMEQSRRRLLSDISHEMGTPLTSIQGYTKAMLDGVIEKGITHYLNLIYEKTKFLDRILQDLFQLSKMETAQIAFNFELVCACRFIRNVYEKYEFDITGINLRFSLVEDVLHHEGYKAIIEMDVERMEQVFANLLFNAKKFSPSGGQIQLEMNVRVDTIERGRVIYKVSDQGTGIAERDLVHIFERFYKGSSSSNSEHSGTGLGLAISKAIVESHQGEIDVQSQVGKGSTFMVTLPCRFVPI